MDTSENNVIQKNNSKIQSEKPVINATDVVFGVIQNNAAVSQNQLSEFKDIFQNQTDTKSSEDLISTLYSSFYSQNLGATVKFNDEEVIMMGSVNYLGLSHHPRVIDATLEAVKQNGIGGIGSRYSNGYLQAHYALEQKFKSFLGKEDCVFFNSGYIANLGVFKAFGDDALIFADKENHLSLYDGCLLSKMKYFRFIHNNAEHLDKLLSNFKGHKNKWVLLVGTFGATGDNSNLKKIIEIAKKHNAKVYLDDAHAIGIYGKNKRGLSELNGVIDDVDILMTSFQMAFGNIGAGIAGKKELINSIRYYSRPYIFSFSLPVHTAVSLNESINIIQSNEGDNLIARLFENVNFLRKELLKIGMKTISNDHNILSYRIESEVKTLQMTSKLLEYGVWVQKYIHPSVPMHKPTIRLTPIATHTKEHLKKTVDAFAAIL